jgi:hypothetical protein
LEVWPHLNRKRYFEIITLKYLKVWYNEVSREKKFPRIIASHGGPHLAALSEVETLRSKSDKSEIE